MHKKVDAYIEKQKSCQKEICQNLRKIIFKTFPDITEEMKWGVPKKGTDLFLLFLLSCPQWNSQWELQVIVPKDVDIPVPQVNPFWLD